MEKTALEKLMELPMNKIKLYNLAWKMYKIGFYNLKDFHKFLEANGILIF